MSRGCFGFLKQREAGQNQMSNEYGCSNCGKKPKRLPYGSKKGLYWCSACDAGHVNTVSKKRERRLAKKEIEKEKK